MRFLFGFVLLLALGALGLPARAQYAPQSVAPRAAALSDANIAVPTDPLDRNCAAAQDSLSIIRAMYAPLPTGIAGTYELGIAALTSFAETFCAGFGFDRFQYSDVYSSEDISLQLAHQFIIDSVRSVSAGLRAHYSTEDFGAQYLPQDQVVLDVGATIAITRELTAGFAVTSLARLYHNQEFDQNPETYLGAAYRIVPEFSIDAAVDMPQGGTTTMRFGAEYLLENFIFIRAGTETATNSVSGGLGLVTQNLKLDFALIRHPVLGNTLSFALGIRL